MSNKEPEPVPNASENATDSTWKSLGDGCGNLISLIVLMPLVFLGYDLMMSIIGGIVKPNIIAVNWDSEITSDIETRCERINTTDDISMDHDLAEFDGWKLIYLSEDTRRKKDALVCFQRAQYLAE
jgi:hypothetical protein